MLIVAISVLASADHGESMGNPWGIYGDLWGMYGGPMGNLWGVYGESMGRLWGASRLPRYLYMVWHYVYVMRACSQICHAIFMGLLVDMSCNIHSIEIYVLDCGA